MYPYACEDIPDNVLSLRDSDYATDKLTRQPVSGWKLLLNNTVFQWGSKRQATVEISTHGTKMIAIHVALDAIIGMKVQVEKVGSTNQRTISYD